MKIVYIIPGFGGAYYCQNCISSMEIADKLRKLSHEAVIVPMYMPLKADLSVNIDSPIFFGAISTYINQKFPIAVRLPGFIRKLLDSPLLLSWATKNSSSADPEGLEDLTISIMKGEAGQHSEELNRLIHWLKNDIKPDIVHLSNALLIGIAEKIKKELKIPVFCNLDDENIWLDKMPESYADMAWTLIREGGNIIDSYISPSRYYADFVHNRASLPYEDIRILSKGVAIEKFTKREPAFSPPAVGFLSRMSESLGLNILVDAFILLKRENNFNDLRLKISGGFTPKDRTFLKSIKKKLSLNGLTGSVDFMPYIFRDDIDSFFDSLSLLCVPVPGGESYATFVLEALASGIPVVEPDFGAYPEIVKVTGGGVIYEENDPVHLRNILADMLGDPEKLKQLGHNGRLTVEKMFSYSKIVKELLSIYIDSRG